MDIIKIQNDLKIDDLKLYLLDVLRISRDEANLRAKETVSIILDELKNSELKNNFKVVKIINNLIHLKKILYDKDAIEAQYFFNNYKLFKSNELSKIKETIDDDEKLIEFVIESIRFLKSSHFICVNRFKKINHEFAKYFIAINLEKEAKTLFNELNQLNCIDDFNWSLETLDEGIVKLYTTLVIEYESKAMDLKSKIKYNQELNELQINSLKEDLNFKVRSLNFDIESKNEIINYQKEHIKKYLDFQPVFLVETYFGDNTPFLINVYNYLVRNQILTMTGWSYFYSCMSINSNEIINLDSKNNLKFIGRFFYCLQDFLQPKFKTDFTDFIMSKFYINEKPINSNFFKNHMRPIYDETLYPNLKEIDAFFLYQKNIYLKPDK